jgi:pyridoxamine 5'-phosphate oxidase
MSVLEPADLDPDPLRALANWFEEARRVGVPEPEAMCLATADAAGRPSARMVLMRGLGPDGVDFYTNYESRKAQELMANPHGAICIYWESLGHQVRMEGPIERLSREQSANYFATRPRGSQLAAWASAQSAELDSREQLLQRVQELESAHPEEVPLPPFWGGFRLEPVAAEFWSAGEFRLHDRIAYKRDRRSWSRTRLSP